MHGKGKRLLYRFRKKWIDFVDIVLVIVVTSFEMVCVFVISCVQLSVVLFCHSIIINHNLGFSYSFYYLFHNFLCLRMRNSLQNVHNCNKASRCMYFSLVIETQLINFRFHFLYFRPQILKFKLKWAPANFNQFFCSFVCIDVVFIVSVMSVWVDELWHFFCFLIFYLIRKEIRKAFMIQSWTEF